MIYFYESKSYELTLTVWLSSHTTFTRKHTQPTPRVIYLSTVAHFNQHDAANNVNENGCSRESEMKEGGGGGGERN
jgi:hypothetical protein